MVGVADNHRRFHPSFSGRIPPQSMQSPQFQLHAEIEDRHWWFVARRQIMRRLVEHVVPPSKQATVVDVGCGTGANLAALADDYDCLGIDTSPEAVRMAQARFPAARFLCGRAPGDLAGIWERAQMVLLMDVLEHVPDDFELLSSLMAAARAGTHFLVTVPADLSLWSEHDESFGHFRRYDMSRFRQLWRQLPVTTLLSSHFNTRLYPLVKAVRLNNRRRGKASGAAGTDFQMPSPRVNRLLTQCFAGESERLTNVLRRRARPYRHGVSLIAVLRRDAGRLSPRTRPAHILPDVYVPAASVASAV